MREVMKKGFTLIELMIVIAIIALLASVALPKFADSSDQAKVANVQGNLANLRTSISMFKVSEGTYPSYGTAGSGEDFEADGTLSTDFQEYYSRSTMPSTPAPSEGNSVTSGSSITATTSADGGGWIYQESNGEIHANLIQGTYIDSADEPEWETE